MTYADQAVDYLRCLELLTKRLGEPAPSRIQLLTGPRQVGKTTLLLELQTRFGGHVLYASGDDPSVVLPGYWERMWVEIEQLAATGTAILLIDEIHLFPDWATRLKGQWDRLKRLRAAVHVVATGSSALRVSSGSRESLAGRFELLTLSHWPAAAVAQVFGLREVDAAYLVVRFGSYPGAMPLRDDLPRWRAYIRDAILEPALARDVLALGNVRRPALLRQVFAIAASAPAQIISLQKLQGQLHDAGALETIAHYLDLLAQAHLVAPLEKHAASSGRRRAAPPKLITLSNALLAAASPDGPPDPEHDPGRFGAWVENSCLAFAWSQGQRVLYWREEPYEVDAVVEGSWGRWAIEVKTGRYSTADLRGLAELSRRDPGLRPLVVTAPGDEDTARRAGLSAISWVQFLFSGPPRGSAG